MYQPRPSLDIAYDRRPVPAFLQLAMIGLKGTLNVRPARSLSRAHRSLYHF